MSVTSASLAYSAPPAVMLISSLVAWFAVKVPAVLPLTLIVCKLLLLPIVVSITYEINRWVGRHDNWLTRILAAPGMWMQKFTTNEPDDDMIRVGIAAVEAVLPEEEGEDRW